MPRNAVGFHLNREPWQFRRQVTSLLCADRIDKVFMQVVNKLQHTVVEVARHGGRHRDRDLGQVRGDGQDDEPAEGTAQVQPRVEDVRRLRQLDSRDPHHRGGRDEDDDDDRTSKADEAVNGFGLILYPESDLNGELPGPSSQSSRARYREMMDQLEGYQVYSRENDRVIEAEKLVVSFLRKKLRAQLDKKIRGQGVNVPRLARDLAMILSAPERDGWNFGEEEGYLDARRLSKLVTSPDFRQLFRKERYQPHSNCCVTFLMDNSGSMKEHIGQVAMLIEIMCRALEQAGASTEILGFTTRSWQGGKLYKRWVSQGKKPNPGRLTELEHIVYKDADTSMRQARQSISAMLKPDIFKEGIDGEALLWAAERMTNRPEERRILIVLSDGCPMETATSQSNDADYLDNHLKHVSSMLEARGDLELYALGFGLDLSPYYRNNLALDLPETLENSVFRDILNMLARRR